MNFPAYAGGKFISNCLCLSKNFIPMYKEFDFNKINDYDYRLAIVCKTLPSSERMKQWLHYEFGEYDVNSEFYKKIKILRLRCCFITHGSEYQSFVDNNREIVKLINYENFRLLAHGLKKTNRPYDDEDNVERFNKIKGSDWPEYKLLATAGFDTRKLNLGDSLTNEINKFYPLGLSNVNVHLFDQNTIFDRIQFLNEVEKLYNSLKMEDFNRELTSIFYTRYAKLHNI